jgi:hypothetical protein
MKTLSLLLLSITILSTNMTMSQSISIIPEPQSMVLKAGQFKITSSTKVILGAGNSTEQFIADQLNDELSARKGNILKISEEKGVRKLSTNYIFIGKPGTDLAKKFLKERNGSLKPEMKAEGYFLDVDAKGAVIIAETEQGLYYGMMSLLQLVRFEGRSVLVPALTIHDYPMQKMRGITDDISRGQISTVENFKKVIKFCARHKMNVYSPYIEDVFLFKNHTVLGKDRGALSAKEWKELDTFAKKHFVEMIPIFETLGHWENYLIHSDYMKYGEFPGAHTVNVSDEKVYALLDEMIGEMASAFSSPYFHMAADESWDVGLGVNKDRVKQSDLATVHAEHYKRIFAIIKKHGKKPVMYGDIILNHPDILQKIPQDVIIVDWQYGARFEYPSPEVFKNAGFPFVVSPAVWNFTGPFPNYLNTFLNIYYLNLDGYRNGSLGMFCSNWNDFGGEALRELNYYGYAWTAECAWNPETADNEKFDGKFFNTFFDARQNDLRAVYSILSNPANQFHWYEIWRHPMLPNRDDMIWEKRLPLIQRMQSINSTMPFVQNVLDDAQKDLRVNADHLKYLQFIARLNLWFAQKVEAQEKIKLLVKDSLITADEKKSRIVSMSDHVIAALMDVKQEFEKVWHTANQTHSIDRLLQRYDRQAAYWKEISALAAEGNFDFDPQLKSKWIYHPKANPGVKDSAQVQKAYFRTMFDLQKKAIVSAKIQLLGDTWTKLYVNGSLAGEVMARRSLSLLVESQRAKIYDITPFIKDSVLVLAAESQNFQENGSAGVNLIGEIVYVDGTKEIIMTDDSWLVSDSLETDWNTVNFFPKNWLIASPKKFGLPIVAPNLSTGRTSWFER